MAHLTLYDYTDNYTPTEIEYAEMQFFNYPDGSAYIDNEGNRWIASRQETRDLVIVNLTTEEEIHYRRFTTELFHSLNIYGLYNYVHASIIGAGYTGEIYGADDEASTPPWMQLISQDIQGTHIIYRDPDNAYTYDPVIAFFGDGNPSACAPLAVHRPDDEVWYGHFACGYGGSSDRYTHIQIVYARYLTKETWGELSLDPGAKGYVPTGTKTGERKGVGGIGSDPIGKRPGYETATLTNPGAPDESSASVCGTGLITAYKMAKSQIPNLVECLYGTKLFTLLQNTFINPLDYIVSFNIFPCSPDVDASRHIKLGPWLCDDSGTGLGSNCSGQPLSNQFKVVSFGSISVPENWGSFLDYSHTSIELYLPFIGFVDIDTSEVMNGSITVDYTIDFLTGMCVANVNCNKNVEAPDGYSYPQSSQHAYQGNCAMTIPISAVQYGNMIGSMIQTGVSAMSGDPRAITGIIGDAIGGGMRISGSSKGSITANAGFCSILAPYLRVTRPVSGEPDSFQQVVGYPSYIDSYLGQCNDLCVCESIDLRSISGATDSEIEQIRQMCLDGVHV